MTTQTLIHLLYFLPALIVYGVWTWIFISRLKFCKTNPNDPVTLSDFIAVAYLIVNVLAFIAFSFWAFDKGIKYFSN